MADRGILFSAPMVLALLEGRKTQTRRLIPHPEYWGCPTGDCPHEKQSECDASMASYAGEIVPHAIGDRLYVREAWAEVGSMDPGLFITRADFPACVPSHYENVPAESEIKWRPSIHQPRAASRLWLLVTDVRVQRLQEITEAESIAEGINYVPGSWTDGGPSPCEIYMDLWNSLHKPGDRWADNPWIYALTFTVHKGNIDAQ